MGSDAESGVEGKLAFYKWDRSQTSYNPNQSIDQGMTSGMI